MCPHVYYDTYRTRPLPRCKPLSNLSLNVFDLTLLLSLLILLVCLLVVSLGLLPSSWVLQQCFPVELSWPYASWHMYHSLFALTFALRSLLHGKPEHLTANLEMSF